MRPISAQLVAFILATSMVGSAHAAKASAQPTAKPSFKAESKAESKAAQGKTLLDVWYTVTVGDGARYSYYNDRLELRDGRLFFQNTMWKKEEGYINEEQLGGVVEDGPELRPLFFNFRSTYRTTETHIDGTFKVNETGKGSRVLTAKIRQGGREYPVISKTVPDKVILSSFFPVWLGKQLGTLKEGQSRSFSGILEDNIEVAFSTVTGRIRMEKPDEFAKKSDTKKIAVDFRDLQSVWYVDQAGVPVRIVMPSQKAVVEKVSKKEAEAFLSESP